MGGRAGGGAGMGKGLRSALASSEASIKGRSIENAYVFDSKGNLVYRKTEGEQQAKNDPYSKLTQNDRSVEVPVEHLKNNIITHNHPSGDSFSSGDLKMAIKGDAAEIRAVGKMTYSLKRPKGGWKVWQGEVIESYRKFSLTSKSKHETMQKLAKKYNWDYTATAN